MPSKFVDRIANAGWQLHVHRAQREDRRLYQGFKLIGALAYLRLVKPSNLQHIVLPQRQNTMVLHSNSHDIHSDHDWIVFMSVHSEHVSPSIFS